MGPFEMQAKQNKMLEGHTPTLSAETRRSITGALWLCGEGEQQSAKLLF
jgi:hypothetical protein